MMNTVRNGEDEPKARMFEPDFESRMDIIGRTSELRRRMLELNPRYKEMLSEYNLPTEKQMIIHGGSNRIIPSNHDTLTLARPIRGAEAVDSKFAKIHLRIALISPRDPNAPEVPSNDVFIEVLHNDNTRDFYLVNSGGAWMYNQVGDIVSNPTGQLTGDLFKVSPEVDQSEFTRERFEDLQVALMLFRPDREDNRSADI